MSTPPVSQVLVESAADGPQRWKETVPLNVETPVTVIFAWSLTSIAASAGSFGISSPPAGIGVVPSDFTGVVSVFDVLTTTASFASAHDEGSEAVVFGESPL